jgi:hypothetical protein
MLRYWVILVFLFVSGCSLPLQIPALADTAVPAVQAEEPPQVDTPQPVQVNCAYVWSTRSLPDLSRQVTVAFHKQGMPEVEVDASAYGEDCINSSTNEVVRFSAMQTDFFIAIVIPDPGDIEALGEWIEKIYQVLEEFPAGGELPGPNPGYIGITFSNGGEQANLWFRRTAGEQALAEGLRGSALYDVLRNPR